MSRILDTEIEEEDVDVAAAVEIYINRDVYVDVNKEAADDDTKAPLALSIFIVAGGK